MNSKDWKQQEFAASERALELVCRTRDEKIEFFGQSLLWFQKQDNRRFVEGLAKWLVQTDPENLNGLIDGARLGADLYQDVLREIMAEKLERGEQLPARLASYCSEVLQGGPGAPRKRARKKSDHVLRDVAIVAIVALVSEEFGISPTGRSISRKSACGIVAEALGSARINLSEKAVEGIWNRNRHVLN